MRTSAAAAFLLLLVCCCAPDAFACRCVPANGNGWPAPKDFLAAKTYNSDNIFLGRALKIEEEKKSDDDPEVRLMVTFEVERYWADGRDYEGVNRSVIHVWTYKYDSMCGFPFEQGARYFVFAKYFQTHYCTPTTKYTEADAPDYFKALGEGQKPERPKSAQPPPR